MLNLWLLQDEDYVEQRGTVPTEVSLEQAAPS